jgi:hypothetical protein
MRRLRLFAFRTLFTAAEACAGMAYRLYDLSVVVGEKPDAPPPEPERKGRIWVACALPINPN